MTIWCMSETTEPKPKRHLRASDFATTKSRSGMSLSSRVSSLLVLLYLVLLGLLAASFKTTAEQHKSSVNLPVWEQTLNQ